MLTLIIILVIIAVIGLIIYLASKNASQNPGASGSYSSSGGSGYRSFFSIWPWGSTTTHDGATGEHFDGEITTKNTATGADASEDSSHKMSGDASEHYSSGDSYDSSGDSSCGDSGGGDSGGGD